MKIRYFSDIHIEFHDIHFQMDFVDTLLCDDADVIVIAGDLDVGNNTIKWLQHIDKRINIPVIFVPGNHEYYGHQKNQLDKLLLNTNFKNVHVLIQGVFKYKDITFVGSTGWWDTKMGLPHLRSLNDFNRIYDIGQYDNGTDWGISDKKFFTKVLKTTDRVVCISHNAPSKNSILPQYYGSDINECFANDWDDLIETYKPIAWIHGHMHNTIKYMINGILVVCNPYGYNRYEVNKEFDVKKYIKI